MPLIAVSAALAASMIWAAGALLAHKPATLMGPFEFTRVTLISAALLLALIVTWQGNWETIAWDFLPSLALSGLVGVLLCNLCFVVCLRRGGPRRAEFLFAMNTPIAAMLGYAVLGEQLSLLSIAGAALVLAGIVLAILHGHKPAAEDALEIITGSIWPMLFFGVLSGLCQAIGFIAAKPALLAGTDPLAASAIRVIISAVALVVVALWPARAFAPLTQPSGALVLRAIPPGVLGYVVASSLLLYALASYDTGVVVVLGSTVPVMILPMIWLRTRNRPPLLAWVGAALVVAGTAMILRA
nr:DMT family transporter [uncultured Dongia sp.]